MSPKPPVDSDGITPDIVIGSSGVADMPDYDAIEEAHPGLPGQHEGEIATSTVEKVCPLKMCVPDANCRWPYCCVQPHEWGPIVGNVLATVGRGLPPHLKAHFDRDARRCTWWIEFVNQPEIRAIAVES